MRRFILNFLAIYLCGLLFLFAVKEIKGYSDYVIPGPDRLLDALTSQVIPYAKHTVGTFAVAILGHAISVIAAFVAGCAVVMLTRVGPTIRSVAYTLQSYPIIAIAPIFFILLGDRLPTCLIITASICYFPMLLTVIGVLSKRVPHVEHFFQSSGLLTKPTTIRIRLMENLGVVVTTVVGSGSLAVVGAIIAEFLAADRGIGYTIRVALYGNKLESILVALLVIGIANWLYLGPLEWLGAKVLKRVLYGKLS